MEPNDDYVRILFRFYSNVLEEHTVETMWAMIIDENAGIYELNSIPFYAPNLACGDIISAAYDEDEEMLCYKETVSYSGNSTVQVIIYDKEMVTNDVRDIFQALGCISEKFSEGYFVMDISVDINYAPVRTKLNELSAAGILDYAEPCLSAAHGNAT